MVSDFFYPRLGGVELHQYQLAQALIQRGHKCVIITGTYHTTNKSNINQFIQNNTIQCDTNGVRQGIRYLSNGLKVYYIPVMSVHQQATIPTYTNYTTLLYHILTREQIDILHGHQATSSLMHEAVLYCTIHNIPCVYTDHSLFGLRNIGSLTLNKLLQFTLCNVSHCISVSYCSKQNLCYRIKKNIHEVSVIPNAVDSTQFTPSTDMQHKQSNPDRIKIIVISRLVYRKGADLLVDIIPVICERYTHVDFIVGGDGNKSILLEQMIERYSLQSRVQLLGNIPHTRVRDLLVTGDIFLNCSLTEAFCIAILEAVSCGLQCISTRVGGVSEILPNDLIRFALPNVIDIINVCCHVIDTYQPVSDVWAQHNRVAQMYNWHNVAERTERVYNQITEQDKLSHIDKLCNYYKIGIFSGKLYCLVYCYLLIYHYIIHWLYPISNIDIAIDFKI